VQLIEKQNNNIKCIHAQLNLYNKTTYSFKGAGTVDSYFQHWVRALALYWGQHCT